MGLAMSELLSEAAIPDCRQHVSFVPEARLVQRSKYARDRDVFGWARAEEWVRSRLQSASILAK